MTYTVNRHDADGTEWDERSNEEANEADESDIV